jgi:hypothetical protein
MLSSGIRVQLQVNPPQRAASLSPISFQGSQDFDRKPSGSSLKSFPKGREFFARHGTKEKVNTERKIAMARCIEAALGGSVRDKTVGVLGVTFKPNTDDMREAPSLVILPMLQSRARTFAPMTRKLVQKPTSCSPK